MTLTIKNILENKNKLVMGKEQVFKLLKHNKLEKIMVSSNSNVEEQAKRLAELSGAEISVSKHDSKELGALLKKSFSINILGLKK